MDLLLVVAIAMLIPLGAAVAYFVHVLAGSRSASATEECLVLSPGKYRPMQRLLQEEEFRFLASQEGYSRELGRRFRTQRRRVFRGYLKSLKKDFGKMTAALRMLIVHSTEDRGDLSSAVLRQQVTFAAALVAIEARLLLHAAGVGAVRIDVSGLIEPIEAMQAQMRMLLAPPEASLAAF